MNMFIGLPISDNFGDVRTADFVLCTQRAFFGGFGF